MLLAAALLALTPAVAWAQADDRPPDAPDRPETEGVRIDEHLEQVIPLGLTFQDEKGQVVQLADYFEPGKPVILNLGYYECPMLCSLTWKGISDAVRKLDWNAGEQYTIITVSIDPDETPDLAGQKKETVIRAMGRPETADGWHFLTGDTQSIVALADAVGYRYNYIRAKDQFAHPTALIVLSPEGKICRYLYGLEYPTTTVRLSLVEASEGKAGSIMDQVLLSCFQYDAASGAYTPIAMGIMRAAGILTALAIGAAIVLMVIVDSRRRRAKANGQGQAAAGT
jgi:protein SCO1/2